MKARRGVHMRLQLVSMVVEVGRGANVSVALKFATGDPVEAEEKGRVDVALSGGLGGNEFPETGVKVNGGTMVSADVGLLSLAHRLILILGLKMLPDEPNIREGNGGLVVMEIGIGAIISSSGLCSSSFKKANALGVGKVSKCDGIVSAFFPRCCWARNASAS